MLFQYHIGAVNSDNTTATIKYDDRCIKDGDHVFQAETMCSLMFATLIRTSVQAGKFQGPCNLPNQSTLNLALCCVRTIPFKVNLADHVDERGRMQLLKIFGDHQKLFPTLWILVQKEASCQLVEVGCERLFGLSGYVF
jgi:hypothetical protein